MICDFGCCMEAIYQFKNGKWCCNQFVSKCPAIIKKNKEGNTGKSVSLETRKTLSEQRKGISKSNETRKKISDAHKGKKLSEEHKKSISSANKGKIFSDEHKQKLKDNRTGKKGYYKGKLLTEEHKKKISESNKGKIFSKEHRKKISISGRMSIKEINEKYPFFSKVEEIRYSPDKPDEIQGHCKYSECENSKEKDGWFTPTASQLHERIRSLEKGVDLSYFYCSQECKDICPLYNSHGADPFKTIKELPYTYEEYQTFRKHVLTRDNRLCQFCGDEATDVHHERPQKLEPFFALDPDFAWSCCEECHYSKGHSGKCNTNSLANKKCSNKLGDQINEQNNFIAKCTAGR